MVEEENMGAMIGNLTHARVRHAVVRRKLKRILENEEELIKTE